MSPDAGWVAFWAGLAAGLLAGFEADVADFCGLLVVSVAAALIGAPGVPAVVFAAESGTVVLVFAALFIAVAAAASVVFVPAAFVEEGVVVGVRGFN